MVNNEGNTRKNNSGLMLCEFCSVISFATTTICNTLTSRPIGKIGKHVVGIPNGEVT
jgi:hypothetical protein